MEELDRIHEAGLGIVSTPEEKDSSRQIIAKIQRDINCLADDNKATRKRAMTKIVKMLEDDHSPGLQQELLIALMKPVLKCFADPMEKVFNANGRFLSNTPYEGFTHDYSARFCPLPDAVNIVLLEVRELAIGAMSMFVKTAPNAAATLPYLVPIFVGRLGDKEIVEISEEVRLDLVKLLADTIVACPNDCYAYMDEFVQVLAKTVEDTFPYVTPVLVKLPTRPYCPTPRRR